MTGFLFRLALLAALVSSLLLIALGILMAALGGTIPSLLASVALIALGSFGARMAWKACRDAWRAKGT